MLNKITTDVIANNAVTNDKIAQGAVTSDKLSNDVLTSTKIGNLIPNGSITGTKISLSSQAKGDIMFYNGTAWDRLPAGISGQTLMTAGPNANPYWGTGETLVDTTFTPFFIYDWLPGIPVLILKTTEKDFLRIGRSAFQNISASIIPSFNNSYIMRYVPDSQSVTDYDGFFALTSSGLEGISPFSIYNYAAPSAFFGKPFNDTNVNNASNKIIKMSSGPKNNNVNFTSLPNFGFIDQNNILWLMGEAGSGQLAQGNTGDSYVPLQAKTGASTFLGAVQDVWVYGATVIALGIDGILYACGASTYGQTGGGRTINQTYFVAIAELGNTTSRSGIKKVVTANLHQAIFVLFNNGELFAAGYGAGGVFGNGSTASLTSYTKITTDNVSDIFTSDKTSSSGFQAVIYKTSSNVFKATGYNITGQLLNGTTTTSTTWVVMTNLGSNVIENFWPFGTSSDDKFYVTFVNDPNLYVWGYNANTYPSGAASATTPLLTPTKVVLPFNGSEVAFIGNAGGAYILLIKKDGTFWISGSSASGQQQTNKFIRMRLKT